MPDFDWLDAPPAETIKLQESFAWVDQEPVLETPQKPDEAMMLRRRPILRRQLRALRQEKLEEFLTELPQPGESLHIVSNGSFDYWNFVPVTIRLLGRPVEFYGSTWTMNRSNVLQLLTLFDKRLVSSVTVFSGLYFKRREPAVYTTLASGLIDRGQRLLCFENHTKIKVQDHKTALSIQKEINKILTLKVTADSLRSPANANDGRPARQGISLVK